MAETRQIVSWALERKCAYRTGDQWFLPGNTSTHLAILRTVASAQSDGRNVDGICVTSWGMGEDNSKNSYRIPHSGFRIEEELGTVGGISAALATCGACEANAKTELGIDVAGCFGHLDIWPDSEELDNQLWGIIKARGLEERLRAAFPLTTPLWYGFWIHSPLGRLQAELLYDILDPACDRSSREDEDVRHFLGALQAAIRWELPVHVSLFSLGHTDFGMYTVFPHCPRCKANAPVGRWKESYPETSHACRACGHEFIPEQHRSSERFDFNGEADSLEKWLREAAYDSFLRAFLRQQNCTPEQVDEVIDNKNHGPLLRRIGAVRKKRINTLERLRQNSAGKSDARHHAACSISLADDLDMEFVLVPAGEFLMGSSATEENTEESPQHVVRFDRPFYMGRYLVTQAQWNAVMNPLRPQGDPTLPVDRVSWFDCQAYCEKLCHRMRRVFRLPSEAEWEYACRAGTSTKYAFGDTLSPDQANFTPFSNDFPNLELAPEPAKKPRHRKGKRSPVGMYPPNAWGLYDMHGNVDEWCEDVWHSSYEGAPTDGSAWLEGETKIPFRVMRGGWASATEFVCTSASRHLLRSDAGDRADEPEEDEDAGTLKALFATPYGFRVVCEIS